MGKCPEFANWEIRLTCFGDRREDGQFRERRLASSYPMFQMQIRFMQTGLRTQMEKSRPGAASQSIGRFERFNEAKADRATWLREPTAAPAPPAAALRQNNCDPPGSCRIRRSTPRRADRK